MPVQGFQHGAVAAEHDQDLGMDGIGLAVAGLQLRQRGLSLGTGSRGESEGGWCHERDAVAARDPAPVRLARSIAMLAISGNSGTRLEPPPKVQSFLANRVPAPHSKALVSRGFECVACLAGPSRLLWRSASFHPACSPWAFIPPRSSAPPPHKTPSPSARASWRRSRGMRAITTRSRRPSSTSSPARSPSRKATRCAAKASSSG